MAALALIISIIALVLAYLAYRKTGGSTDELKAKVEDLGITTETLRKRTADALNRLEKTVRGGKPAQEKSEGEQQKTSQGETEEPKE